jgi:hypothetical protein
MVVGDIGKPLDFRWEVGQRVKVGGGLHYL